MRLSAWTVDLSAAYASTELRGNGAAPVELLAIDRSAVFTHPDLTENEQLILEGSTDGYAILNLRGAWHVSDNAMLFARVENVFDEDYATFGLLGDPGEVFAEFTDPRFLGAGPPRGAWVGARVKW